MRLHRAVAALVAGLAVAASALIGAPSAYADSGVWGPAKIPYSNGVVCTLGASDTALVSWPNSAGSAPAFSRQPITGPTGGLPGAYATPATSGTVGLAPIDIAQQRGLAVLLGFYGASGDAATVANVAAVVSNDTACFDAGIPGVDAAAAQKLMAQSQSFAGPYTVTVGSSAKLVPGTPGSVFADVRSASGTPLSDVSVSFRADGTSLTATGTTDDAGRAGADVQLPDGWTSAQLVVHATIALPVTLVQVSAPDAVPLLAAAPPEEATGQAAVPVDTTADPAVQVKAAPALVLTGMAAEAQIAVTGMRGHAGTAAVTAIGPLAFRSDSGCASYQRGDWESGPTIQVADGVTFTGDTTVPVSLEKLVDDKGCYLLQAKVVTTDATPQASANSNPGDAAAVLGVAPLKVTAVAAHAGLALRGPLAAALTVDGSVPATLTGTSGALFGPRLAERGDCPTGGWDHATSAGALTATADGDAATDVSVASPAVAKDGCYLLRMNTTVEVGSIGSIAVSDQQARILVLDPHLSVTQLSSHGVTVGDQVRATVGVTGTLTHRGSLTLRLARLTDDRDGCFGRDYRQATAASDAKAPAMSTTGDGSFVATTAAVPSTGCWTVLPTLTLDGDAALRVAPAAPEASMVAFTAVQPVHAADIGDGATDVDHTTRLVIAGILAAVLVIGALVVTLRLAFATADDDD